MVIIFLSFVALVATIYPLVDFGKITPQKSSIISIVFMAILVLYGFLVFYEIRTADGKRVFNQDDKVSIKNYMCYWIANGGRVAIWTRDMSWVDDERSKEFLLDKAKKDELIICLPSKTAFAKDLEDVGATIYEYGDKLLSDPSARFTIAYYGRDGSKVAIGRAKEGKHVVEEFDSGSHPAFHLACELVQIAKNISQISSTAK